MNSTGKVTGAVFTPFATTSACLLVADHFLIASDAFSWAALALGTAIGASFIATLPISRLMRAGILLVYVPLVTIALIVFCFFIAIVVFHDGL